MASASPAIVKVAAALLGMISLRTAIGAGSMVWRFGALGDAAFLFGVAACLFLVAVGIHRGRVDGLALGVAVLATIAARLMLDALPIIKYRLFEPVKWAPLVIAVAVGITALLLPLVPNARRWLTEPAPMNR
jgi:hypothetical protein